MASKLVIKNGIASGVYDDRLLPIYEVLGVPQITRASVVEYDHERRQWVARACDRQGSLIAAAPTRAQAIALEVKALESRLCI